MEPAEAPDGRALDPSGRAPPAGCVPSPVESSSGFGVGGVAARRLRKVYVVDPVVSVSVSSRLVQSKKREIYKNAHKEAA